MTRLALTFLVALAACGAPESFDGVTGGIHSNDPTVRAPRPISPLSVTWVSSLRPVLRWQLSGDLTGAVIELCRTRSCEPVEKSFIAAGAELTLPNELEPGVWFWRLRGVASSRAGQALSPTWEFVVRTPGVIGPSSAPWGSVTDVNGDGEPDLLVGVIGNPAELLVYHGKKDGLFPEEPSQRHVQRSEFARPEWTSIASGTDYNGDGYSDVVISGASMASLEEPPPSPPPPSAESKPDLATVYLGNANELRPDDFGSAGPIRTMREAGDTNGDGYGDLLVMTSYMAHVIYGAPRYSLFNPNMEHPPGEDSTDFGRAVFAGMDVDGDGFGDVLMSERYVHEFAPGSAFLVLGRGDLGLGQYDLLETPGRGDAALAISAADLTGDGLADPMVLVADSPSSTRLCWNRGTHASAQKADAPIVPLVECPMTFDGEQSLAGADLDASGQDWILACGAKGCRALKPPSPAPNAPEAVGPPNARLRGLAVLWPGRPGPARWAVLSADGKTISVHRGRDEIQKLQLPSGLSADTIR